MRDLGKRNTRMYLLNDGKSLELSMDRSSSYTTLEEREKAIRQIRLTKLPLLIRIKHGQMISPVQVRFIQDAILTVRTTGGRVKIMTDVSRRSA